MNPLPASFTPLLKSAISPVGLTSPPYNFGRLRKPSEVEPTILAMPTGMARTVLGIPRRGLRNIWPMLTLSTGKCRKGLVGELKKERWRLTVEDSSEDGHAAARDWVGDVSAGGVRLGSCSGTSSAKSVLEEESRCTYGVAARTWDQSSLRQ